MPRAINNEIFDFIINILSNFPNGATIEEIKTHRGSDAKIQTRTLQRRLSEMVKQGKVKRIGSGRGTRYDLVEKRELIKKIEFDVPITRDYSIPLSYEAEKIKNYVQQEIQFRKPVSYQRNLLEDYEPNKNFYLPDDVRNKFHKEGKLNPIYVYGSTYTKQILSRLLIDLSWNSSRLEGNTYSLLETERLLIEGKEAEGKNAFETQMILNHKAAIDFLVANIETINFNNFTILNLHALLADGLLGNPNAYGKLRAIPVGISKTVYHPPEIPQLIEEYFYKILHKASLINDPFEQAFFVMVHLPYLQPFEDVNKRVSRLAANIPLMKNHLCPLSFIHVPEKAYIDGLLGVYESQRIELLCDVFIFAYERSIQQYAVVQQTLKEPDPFRFRYRREIKDIIASVVTQKLNKSRAAVFINQWAEHNLPKKDRLEFVTMIETELLALTEGNIARYGLSLALYSSWQKEWHS